MTDSDSMRTLRALLETKNPAPGAVVAALLALPVSRKQPSDAFERFVFSCRASIDKQRVPFSPQAAFRDDSPDPRSFALAAALCEHEEPGWAWPFARLHSLSDDEALAWLRLLERLPRAPKKRNRCTTTVLAA
jgi:hypothetical protein